MYPLRFCRSFEFKYFWFPQFGRTEAQGVGLRGVRWGISDGESVTSYRSHYKALRCCYSFATVFNVFLITSNLGKVIRLQCGLLTYPCGVLFMWAYVLWAFVLWAFVRVGFCPDTSSQFFGSPYRYNYCELIKVLNDDISSRSL